MRQKKKKKRPNLLVHLHYKIDWNIVFCFAKYPRCWIKMYFKARSLGLEIVIAMLWVVMCGSWIIYFNSNTCAVLLLSGIKMINWSELASWHYCMCCELSWPFDKSFASLFFSFSVGWSGVKKVNCCPFGFFSPFVTMCSSKKQERAGEERICCWERRTHFI